MQSFVVMPTNFYVKLIPNDVQLTNNSKTDQCKDTMLQYVDYLALPIQVSLVSRFTGMYDINTLLNKSITT